MRKNFKQLILKFGDSGQLILDPEDIEYLSAWNIVKHLMLIDCSKAIYERDIAKDICLILKKSANKQFDSFGTVFERLMYSRDIVTLRFVYEDETQEIDVDWKDEDEYGSDNKRQTFAMKGDSLLIAIGKLKAKDYLKGFN